ncbi:hypothetical protein GCM10027403_18770 [Arthrobacter tecti]
MSELLGANVEELESLAERFSQSAETLRGIRSTLTVGVINNTGWAGPDAESLRSSWDSHQMAIMLAANTLDRGSRDLLEQARQQETASDAGSGAIGGSSGAPGFPGTPAGHTDEDFSIWEALGQVAGFGMDINKMFKLSDIQKFIANSRILDITDMRNISLASEFLDEASKFTKWSRFAGPLLAPLGIAGGIHDVFNPDHEGWRGVGDRVAGGVGAFASGGTLLLAAGALGPVGAAVVVGAGLAAGAWALGNYVYDNWDNITEWTSNAWDATTDFVGDTWDGATDIAGDAWEGATDLADSLSDGVGDFVEDPIGSIGGLFS